MRSYRRLSVKGKGADIFLGVEETTTAAPPAKQKASFYLSVPLLEALDRLWLELRLLNRRLTKSELVQAALEEMLKVHQADPPASPLTLRFVPPAKSEQPAAGANNP